MSLQKPSQDGWLYADQIAELNTQQLSDYLERVRVLLHTDSTTLYDDDEAAARYPGTAPGGEWEQAVGKYAQEERSTANDLIMLPDAANAILNEVYKGVGMHLLQVKPTRNRAYGEWLQLIDEKMYSFQQLLKSTPGL